MKISKNINVIILVLILVANSYGQETKPIFIHSFSNAISFTLEGGATFTNSDFKNNRFDYLGRGMIEYFFYSNSIGTFGLRFYGGLSYLGGEGGIDQEYINQEYLNIETLKTSVYYVAGGYSYTLSIGDVFHPYIFAGLSYINFYPKSNDNIRISSLTKREFAKEDLNYIGEVGLRILFHNNFSLNLSGTANINPSDNLDGIFANDNNDIFYSANMGISYYFLHAKDSDGDGVDDSEDMCPNTLPHINVNEFGCPLDSDNDGVPDDKDICPKTPISIVVNENGCPVDLDEDGIPDQMDECLYTPKGVEVDSVGCPMPIVEDTTFNRFVIGNFGFAKSEIPEKSFQHLKELLVYMLDNPELEWEIEGHSDDVSINCDTNFELSVKRSQMVSNFLIERGVNSERIKIIGFSEYRPIADNNFAIGRSLNRRVEIIKQK